MNEWNNNKWNNEWLNEWLTEWTNEKNTGGHYMNEGNEMNQWMN